MKDLMVEIMLSGIALMIIPNVLKMISVVCMKELSRKAIWENVEVTGLVAVILAVVGLSSMAPPH